MKTFFLICMAFTMTMNISACSADNPTTGPTGNISENNDNKNKMKIKITVGNHQLTATLENNATTRSFVDKLPFSCKMLDLYSREMCYRFADPLPTDHVSSRGYEIGEIIYYPPTKALVIMYEQNGERFGMQTMGRIDSNIDIFRNTGDTDVLFELMDNEN